MFVPMWVMCFVAVVFIAAMLYVILATSELHDRSKRNTALKEEAADLQLTIDALEDSLAAAYRESEALAERSEALYERLLRIKKDCEVSPDKD